MLEHFYLRAVEEARAPLAAPPYLQPPALRTLLLIVPWGGRRKLQGLAMGHHQLPKTTFPWHHWGCRDSLF